MRKAMIFAEFPAPYRVAVFEILAKKYDIEVFYETTNTEERSKDYAVKDASFLYYFLSDENGRTYFSKRLKSLTDFDFILIYNACIKNGIILAYKAKTQNVAYFVNNDGGFIRRNFVKDYIKRKIFCNATMCFASGEVSKKYFKAYGVSDDKIKLHNFTSLTEKDILEEPVSKTEKESLRKKYELPTDKIIIITVGQFIYRKGFDLLLSAWREIDHRNDAMLLIIGGGSQRANYESFITENNFKNVSLIDFLEKKTLFEFYKAADIFAFPTREDIWGLVINEAMACGLPVVSSDQCLAAVELVKNGINGYLYSFEDIGLLTGHIIALIENEKARLTMATRNIEKMQGNTMKAIAEKHISDIEDFFEKNQAL